MYSNTHSLILTDFVNLQAFNNTVQIQTPHDLKSAVSILSFNLSQNIETNALNNTLHKCVTMGIFVSTHSVSVRHHLFNT